MIGLVSDIGGTNARVALVDHLQIRTVKVYPTKKFKGAADIFIRFQKDIDQELPRKWAIAAAGVTTDDRIRGTNIGWDIVKDELVAAFHLETCILLNDFEAAAYGLLTIKKDSLVQIGGQIPGKKCTKVLIGAGTGLGEATCVFCPNDEWKVLKSEGGHCSFAPTDQIETRLLAFLNSKYGHVSYERILSGAGLVDLYKFLLKEQNDPDADAKIERPSQVTSGAKNGDTTCQRTLDLFCRIYGEEAGNLALKTLPEGGVFVGGGIALHILDWLQKGTFQKGFESKGRMKELLKTLPVFVVNEPYLGIYGGAYKLFQTSMSKTASTSLGA